MDLDGMAWQGIWDNLGLQNGQCQFFLTCSVPNVIGNLGWKVFLDYFLVEALESW